MKAINYFDDAGCLVFNMYLFDDPFKSTMSLRFSIDRTLISTENTERYIRCIEERIVDDSMRQYFVKRLFECIKNECKLSAATV